LVGFESEQFEHISWCSLFCFSCISLRSPHWFDLVRACELFYSWRVAPLVQQLPLHGILWRGSGFPFLVFVKRFTTVLLHGGGKTNNKKESYLCVCGVCCEGGGGEWARIIRWDFIAFRGSSWYLPHQSNGD
jgi:hypothetical protein